MRQNLSFFLCCPYLTHTRNTTETNVRIKKSRNDIHDITLSVRNGSYLLVIIKFQMYDLHSPLFGSSNSSKIVCVFLLDPWTVNIQERRFSINVDQFYQDYITFVNYIFYNKIKRRTIVVCWSRNSTPSSRSLLLTASFRYTNDATSYSSN